MFKWVSMKGMVHLRKKKSVVVVTDMIVRPFAALERTPRRRHSLRDLYLFLAVSRESFPFCSHSLCLCM